VVARRAGPRNFSCERRKRFSGQKPRAGRQPGYRQAAPRTDNTPRVSCAGLSATKAAGGGDAKSFLRCGVRVPGGGGSPRGARVAQGLHRLCANTALSAGSKALKSAGGVAGAGQTAGDFAGTARGHDSAGETRYGSAVRDKPLKGKPWTWLRDETSPQGWWRSKPSRACETPRTELEPGLGTPGKW